MEIATATDFRIIQNNAYVHSVHAMIGASPGWGGGRRLTDIIGRKHALRMLGTSVRIDANEALEIGLCDEISENKNELISQAEQLLRPYIDQRFPRSVQGVKRVVSSYQSESNQVERSVFESRWLGEDNKQALEGIL
jgi:enoyl-CoA hydratase/carnithine racemase